MKFDNVAAITEEAREIVLPLGKSTVTFNVIHTDTRSPSYFRVRATVNKKYDKLIAANALPDHLDRQLAIRAFVKHSVRGWSGVTSDGEPVPFTEDNCVEFLMASQPTFYDLLQEAQDGANFAPSEDEAKN